MCFDFFHLLSLLTMHISVKCKLNSTVESFSLFISCGVSDFDLQWGGGKGCADITSVVVRA